MRLVKFHVTDFRSVKDSGWIEADAVTALIGTNESGKTNLLLPLWKLNPAKEGEISPTDDYPRSRMNEFRKMAIQPVFITAVFEPPDVGKAKLAALIGSTADRMTEVVVQRRFSGEYIVTLPNAEPVRSVDAPRVLALLDAATTEINGLSELAKETGVKDALLAAVVLARRCIAGDTVDASALTKMKDLAAQAVPDDAAPRSLIVPRFSQLLDSLDSLLADVSHPAPSAIPAVRDYVLETLPKFVYYSNYGNLDSEIYLPHVIDNLKRMDLGAKDLAKARTLKVLFEFVSLSPQEIRELGEELVHKDGTPPTPEEIAADNEDKRVRSILLQAASSTLTTKFREWWKQGVYRFRFEADGNHFRIWVSDDLRPDEIELEGRSTGLQWFLSFYLVFLVESGDSHAGAILLLDEPGLTLHPMAQRDLSAFFESLSQTNQLLFTTHSPFLVDADHLDRARKVYVDAAGFSKATADLRAGGGDPAQRGSNYAVASALGISVAESLMLGCTPVIVEGPSDQLYLTGIKSILVASGNLNVGREIVFPPAHGVKGVKAVISVLGAKGDELPLVVLDNDKAGKELAANLTAKDGLYEGAPHRVVDFGAITGMAGAEVEDLIAADVMVDEFDRIFKHDTPFGVTNAGTPIVPQMNAWAAAHSVALEPGWKVELAKRVKRRLLNKGVPGVDASRVTMWKKLFEQLQKD